MINVDGGESAVSRQLLSFANPMISDVLGSGLHADTTGGAYVLLHGSNFGAVDFAADLRAWATPTYDHAVQMDECSRRGKCGKRFAVELSLCFVHSVLLALRAQAAVQRRTGVPSR